MPKDPRKIISLFTLTLFMVGVGIFAYLGVYNRYWADDWCYNADLLQLGFIGALKGYTYITTYASNRFSLTLFSGIFHSLGIPGVQLMTPLNILILCASLYWVMRNVKRITNSSWHELSLAAFSLMVVYYSLLLAPHLYQSVYWRSGSLPYFEPLVMGVLISALITHQAIQEKRSAFLIGITAILSFLTGGFSEAACAALVTFLILFIAVAFFLRKQTWAGRSLPVAIPALVSTLLALILLVISPTSSHRLGLYGSPAGLMELPLLILNYSYDFVKYSFLDLPLPHIAMTGTSILLGYLLYDPGKRPLSIKEITIAVLVIVTITFILISSSYAPSAYIERVPPHARTRIIPRFILTAAIIVISWMLGAFMRRQNRISRYQAVAIILLGLMSIYTIRSILILSRTIHVYSERANSWDARALQIEEEKMSGLMTINIQAIDGSPVGGVRDFEEKGQGKPGYWINRCAARYYGVEAIDVISP